ncbi:MAG: tetratricopeptide repeat protein [Fretibacterium sp.]|nr:tetratricopeptide repeat protein [Fretibacterium sp.]
MSKLTEHPERGKKARRRFLRALVGALLLWGLGSGGTSAWANGNVSADEKPAPPIKKSVRKAPVRRPVKKAPAKKATKKAPVKSVKKVEKAAPKLTSLQRGIALMQQERCEKARPWLQKAVQEERHNPNAWYWYGLCHEKMGQFEQAQVFFTRALDCDPTFPPLSRLVAYPSDGERVPLWDPLRPARVYPIPTDDLGIAVIPPDAPQARRRPAPPLPDPERPRVPVYIPPEPGAMPDMGNPWQPGVYVPPGPGETLQDGGPVYVPPETWIGPEPLLQEAPPHASPGP